MTKRTESFFGPDILCFSHLRWNSVFQRPHHLLSRFARRGRVFFIEEPVADGKVPRLEKSTNQHSLTVVTPHLPAGLSPIERELELSTLICALVERSIRPGFVSWYYTPMAVRISADLEPSLIVYDCMDQLSAFDGADPELLTRENELLEIADLVFTGGHSLYLSKRHRHHSVHCFPSSVDKAHFRQAALAKSDPHDMAPIPRPRIGFYGVLDERLDRALLSDIAAAKPEWQFVMIGPVVKIDPSSLPRHPNIHYLGPKSYSELPAYLGRWDVAMMPFARNRAAEFISPTKTPEYLAGGAPVVSTPVRDVVMPYGEKGLVEVAGTSGEFVEAIERALTRRGDRRWKSDVAAFLASMSWDATFEAMASLLQSRVSLNEDAMSELLGDSTRATADTSSYQS